MYRRSLLVAPLLAAALLAAAPAAAPAQIYSTPRPFAPSVPSYVTSTYPTYLTSINYPWVYGAYTMWYTPTSYIEGGMNPPFQVGSYYSHGNRAPGIPQTTVVSPMAAPTQAAMTSAPTFVTLDIRVPPEAEVRIQGKKMGQTGYWRHFQSPPLTPGQAYSYTIDATWRDSGRDVTRTKEVTVYGGDHKEVVISDEAPTPYRSTLRGTSTSGTP